MASLKTPSQNEIETYALLTSLAVECDLILDHLGDMRKGDDAMADLALLVERGWVEKVDEDEYRMTPAGIVEAGHRIGSWGGSTDEA